jgi:hypothetical protein
MESTLIELAKVIIVGMMGAVTLGSLLISQRLNKLLAPLVRELRHLHQENVTQIEANSRLDRIQERYTRLFSHVDDVDTAEFSAGEIQNLNLQIFNRKLTAAAAHSWLRQAPGLLISLGLLGTFAGLTVGLGQISNALGQNAPQETIKALKDILAPMGAAFQTSLLGLFLSLLVLIISQLNGSRDGLERCETLLSSWLETVLPQQLGNKLLTPLHKSIGELNISLSELPNAVYTAVDNAMQRAFADKLEAVFNTHADLATEAQTSIRQLSAIANALHESGEDLLQASQVFRHSDFAASLQQSADHLQASGEQLSRSSEKLSLRLQDVRDNLISTQAEWKVLAEAAAQELQASRMTNAQIIQFIPELQAANASLQGGTQSLADASKQLRYARLEVMKDRKLAQELANALEKRLSADASLSNSCQTFTTALETALSNWIRNVERLDLLSSAYIETLRVARQDDEQLRRERAKATGKALHELRQQLQGDLNAAVDKQRTANSQAREPTDLWLQRSQNLLSKLETLQTQINAWSTESKIHTGNQENLDNTSTNSPKDT